MSGGYWRGAGGFIAATLSSVVGGALANFFEYPALVDGVEIQTFWDLFGRYWLLFVAAFFWGWVAYGFTGFVASKFRSEPTQWQSPAAIWLRQAADGLHYVTSGPGVVRWSWVGDAIVIELDRSAGKPKAYCICSDPAARWSILNYGSDSTSIHMQLKAKAGSLWMVQIMPETMMAFVERTKSDTARHQDADKLEADLQSWSNSQPLIAD